VRTASRSSSRYAAQLGGTPRLAAPVAATGQQYLNLGGPAAGTSLESLYVNRSVWVRARRAAAARVYNTLGRLVTRVGSRAGAD
jgi:hypothetical protein